MTGSPSPLTVSGVTAGKAYTCHVSATNGVGTSADVARVVAFGGRGRRRPRARRRRSLSSGNSAINVAFTPGAPTATRSSTTPRRARSTNGGTAGRPAASSPLTVNGLTNGMTYLCHVATTNDVGTGPASPDSVARRRPPRPRRPQPTVTPGDSQITVSFTPPSLNGSLRSPPYTAACLSTNGGAAGLRIRVGLPGPRHHGVNSNGLTYTCHVTAHNTVGGGPHSPESVPVTPAGIPDPPAAPTITPGNNFMQVAFTARPTTAAADHGLQHHVHLERRRRHRHGSGPTSPVTVTGLTNGNTYTC